MNNEFNYIKFSRITSVIVIIFFAVSFFAIQCIQKVDEIDNHTNSIPVKIDDGDDKYIIDDKTKIDSKTNEEKNENKDNKTVANKKKTTYVSKNANATGEGNYQEEPVDDGVVEYVVVKNKNIFSNEYFTGSVIAPGVDGTYDFEIINNRKSKIIYKITAADVNNNNINLKYRLKRGNEYVIGNEDAWVNISNLKLENVSLASNNNHSYTLEWSWPYEGGLDDTDTQAGENDSSKYILKISIYAEDA